MDKLECEIGNDCVACSLNERRELLALIAPFAAEGNTEDSVTVLRRVAEFYQTHVGEGRVVVFIPSNSDRVFVTNRLLSEHEQAELAELQWLPGIKRELSNGPAATTPPSTLAKAAAEEIADLSYSRHREEKIAQYIEIIERCVSAECRDQSVAPDGPQAKACPHCNHVDCECSDFDVSPDMGAK